MPCSPVQSAQRSISIHPTLSYILDKMWYVYKYPLNSGKMQGLFQVNVLRINFIFCSKKFLYSSYFVLHLRQNEVHRYPWNYGKMQGLFNSLRIHFPSCYNKLLQTQRGIFIGTCTVCFRVLHPTLSYISHKTSYFVFYLDPFSSGKM